MVNWTEEDLAAYKQKCRIRDRAGQLDSCPPDAKPKRGDEEHQEQVSLMKWVEYQAPSCPALYLLFAIPNGGDRNVIVAKKLKAEGVRRGVPDLFLAFPVKPYSGLFIEMKKKKGGQTSKEQKKWIKGLREQGYWAEVCAGAAVAQAVIMDYLEGGIQS